MWEATYGAEAIFLSLFPLTSKITKGLSVKAGGKDDQTVSGYHLHPLRVSRKFQVTEEVSS